MKIRIIKYLFSVLILISLFSFDTKKCASKLEMKEIKENSFLIKIEAASTFTAELFYIQEGEYISQEVKSGNGNSEIEFTNIEKGKIYKIVVNYSDSNPLCETRQLSGLKL
jgi:hypothetical protein